MFLRYRVPLNNFTSKSEPKSTSQLNEKCKKRGLDETLTNVAVGGCLPFSLLYVLSQQQGVKQRYSGRLSTENWHQYIKLMCFYRSTII